MSERHDYTVPSEPQATQSWLFVPLIMACSDPADITVVFTDDFIRVFNSTTTAAAASPILPLTEFTNFDEFKQIVKNKLLQMHRYSYHGGMLPDTTNYPHQDSAVMSNLFIDDRPLHIHGYIQEKILYDAGGAIEGMLGQLVAALLERLGNQHIATITILENTSPRANNDPVRNRFMEEIQTPEDLVGEDCGWVGITADQCRRNGAYYNATSGRCTPYGYQRRVTPTTGGT